MLFHLSYGILRMNRSVHSTAKERRKRMFKFYESVSVEIREVSAN